MGGGAGMGSSLPSGNTRCRVPSAAREIAIVLSSIIPLWRNDELSRHRAVVRPYMNFNGAAKGGQPGREAVDRHTLIRPRNTFDSVG